MRSILFGLLVASCGGSAPLSSHDRTPAALVEPEPAANSTAESPQAGELSDNQARYSAVGIPDPSRGFTPNDYRLARIGLKRLLAEGDPDALPVRGSPLFERLVNPKNLDPLSDLATSLDERVSIAQSYLAAVPPLLGLYLAEGRPTPEQVPLAVLMLELVGRAADLAQQQVASAPDSADAKQGYLQAKQALSATIRGGLSMLRESSFGPDDRKALVTVCSRLISRFATQFPPEQRSQLGAAIEQLLVETRSRSELEPLARARESFERP